MWCLKKLVSFCMFCSFMNGSGLCMLYFFFMFSLVKCWLVQCCRYWCMLWVEMLVMLLDSMFLVNCILYLMVLVSMLQICCFILLLNRFGFFLCIMCIDLKVNFMCVFLLWNIQLVFEVRFGSRLCEWKQYMQVNVVKKNRFLMYVVKQIWLSRNWWCCLWVLMWVRFWIELIYLKQKLVFFLIELMFFIVENVLVCFFGFGRQLLSRVRQNCMCSVFLYSWCDRYMCVFGVLRCWYRFSIRLLDMIELLVVKNVIRWWIRWCLFGDILLCRLVMLIWKLIFFIVQVFLIVFWYMLQNCGQCIGCRVSLKLGLSSICLGLLVMGVFLNFWVKMLGMVWCYFGVFVLQLSMVWFYRCEVFECWLVVGIIVWWCCFYWYVLQVFGFFSEQVMVLFGLNILVGVVVFIVVLVILVVGCECRQQVVLMFCFQVYMYMEDIVLMFGFFMNKLSEVDWLMKVLCLVVMLISECIGSFYVVWQILCSVFGICGRFVMEFLVSLMVLCIFGVYRFSFFSLLIRQWLICRKLLDRVLCLNRLDICGLMYLQQLVIEVMVVVGVIVIISELCRLCFLMCLCRVFQCVVFFGIMFQVLNCSLLLVVWVLLNDGCLLCFWVSLQDVFSVWKQIVLVIFFDSVWVLVLLNGRCLWKNMFCRFMQFRLIGCQCRLVWWVVLIGQKFRLMMWLSWCMVRCMVLVSFLKLNLLCLLKWLFRLIEFRLYIVVLLLEVIFRILVYRLDRWIMLFGCRVWLLVWLYLFLKVIQLLLVLVSVCIMWVYSLCVGMVWLVLFWVLVCRQVVLKVLLNRLVNFGMMCGLNSDYFWLVLMCFMNRFGIQLVRFRLCVWWVLLLVLLCSLRKFLMLVCQVFRYMQVVFLCLLFWFIVVMDEFMVFSYGMMLLEWLLVDLISELCECMWVQLMLMLLENFDSWVMLLYLVQIDFSEFCGEFSRKYEDSCLWVVLELNRVGLDGRQFRLFMCLYSVRVLDMFLFSVLVMCRKNCCGVLIILWVCGWCSR